MLACAIISTIIILLMLIRRWLLSKLKCICQCPAQQDTAPAPPAPPVPQPNPAFTPKLLDWEPTYYILRHPLPSLPVLRLAHQAVDEWNLKRLEQMPSLTTDNEMKLNRKNRERSFDS